MSRFRPYSPEQAYLLPPSVKDELGSSHLCFFVREVVRRLDLGSFEQSYSEQGGALYAPELMLGNLALCLCAGHHQRAAGDAAAGRGPGLPLSGRRRAGGQLGAERVSPPASEGSARCLYPGAGVGQSQGMVKLGRVAPLPVKRGLRCREATRR